MEELIISAIRGAISGSIYGIAGYAKGSVDKKFDLNAFLRAPVIGALAGGVAGFSGIEIESGYDYIEIAGYVAIVDMTIKAITRRYGDRIINFLSD